jgi:hypothetical protein
MICSTITIGIDAVESSRTNRELRSLASHPTAKIQGVTTAACKRTASQNRSRIRNQSGVRRKFYTIALGILAARSHGERRRRVSDSNCSSSHDGNVSPRWRERMNASIVSSVGDASLIQSSRR